MIEPGPDPLQNYRIAIAQRMNVYKGERIGQAAFNVLREVRPDLADMIRGKPFDPFYAHKVDDRRFIKFVQFLEERW